MSDKILSYRAVIKKDGKYYHGYVPLLPGCHTQGETIEETRKNLREAIEGWLETRIENNLPVPSPHNDIETIEHIDPNKLRISKAIKYA